MKFLQVILATMLGFLISLFIIFIFGIALISSVASNIDIEGNRTTNPVSESSVLRIGFEKNIKEYDQPLSVNGMELDKGDNGLLDYLKAIKYAANDRDIEGIYLGNQSLSSGIAQAKELRDAIKTFKESGKFVYAYSDSYSQLSYYLKSVADSIFLNPLGSVDLKGLGSQQLYFKDFQETVGVEIQVIRHGKYKSAVEPFLSNKMSDENKKQISAFLNSIWSNISEEIAESRHLPISSIDNTTNILGGRDAEKALQNRLIDKIMYLDEVEESLRNRMNLDKNTKIPVVDIDDYTDFVKVHIQQETSQKIAVIYAQGDIKYGKSSKGITPQQMLDAFREIYEDDNIKGVVLRVDSPGGSVLASDIIWREVFKLNEKKPVYVSMGNFAASGGYYISCNASKIFAQKSTLTGSIGVFGIFPTAEKLAKKLGIHTHNVTTHSNSIMFTPFEKLSKNKRAIVKENIENIYQIFLERVSKGRNMTKSQVDEIAQGRVWSGADAKNIGLVDEFGGLEKTINSLANSLDLQSYGIKKYPRNDVTFESFEDLLKNIKMYLRNDITSELESSVYGNFKIFKELLEHQGIQARLPYDFYVN